MISPDTRITQARAAIDDARTTLADLNENLESDQLRAARCSLNISLRHLDVLEQKLRGEQPA